MMIDQLSHIAHRGIELARELFDAQLATDQIAQLFRVDVTTAGNYRRVAAKLYGKCASDDIEFRRQAIEHARLLELSIDELVLINQQVNKLAVDIEYSREKLRLDMIQLAHGKNFSELYAACKKEVREHNIKSSKPPRSSVKVSKGVDEYGMRTIVARLNDEVFRAFFSELERLTASEYDRSSGLDYRHARAQALLRMYYNKATSTDIGVHVIMTARELFDGLNRDTYALTDGSVISIDAIHERIKATGWVVVYDDDTLLPIEAAVIEQRSTNKKQRQALIGHTTVCAAPGCLLAVKYGGQAHHIIAAKNGGPTSIPNLVMLCPYHHGQVTSGHATVSINDVGEYVWQCNYSKRKSINRPEVIEFSGHELARGA
ncbi:Endonuclease [Corynebacterium kutscheri]|uniref:Endonuclease n=2 Tax=Corynebacterium kutscheri TaxID=35755 RepID=A0A0F6TCW7_9CORY|nr:hypothetical protein UL82_05200 [Corynebacterium kutscheri]VEH08492.1 Endonuclease [Corynebacterium kutscheri]VEH09538.1 Endonuclease [Corynebacterium kutscheri]VEH79621.1 Endonuclease [Corynebacterium kutscheri]